MRPAFLVGIDFEAAILKRASRTPSPLIAIARQGDAAATRARLEALIAAGADAMVSFGIAGALDPALKPGMLVAAEAVIDLAGGGTIATDEGWRRTVLENAGGVRGQMVTAAAAVVSRGEKARLFADTGAIAVDMESAIAGLLAAERGLPFLVVRAIADDAGLALPAAALAGVDAEGNVRPLATMAALIKRPGELAGLMRLARASGRARHSLTAVAPRLVAGGRYS